MRRLIGSAIIVLVLAACGADPVPVARPNLNEVEKPLCEDFIRVLPDEVGGLAPREVTPPNGLSAAWGDPAVIVTCGGLMPPEFTDDSACEEIAGVGWFTPEDQLKDPGVDAQVTTIGIEPLVSVLIPAKQRGDAAAILTDLAPHIRSKMFISDPCV